MIRAIKLLAMAAFAVLLGGGLSAARGAQPELAGPALETPIHQLNAALHCWLPVPFDMAQGDRKDPVLLVHGTGGDSHAWTWNYLPALNDAGHRVCIVDLPTNSMADVQSTAEYVVHALRLMNDVSKRKVAVIGHSQGGLQPRWALRWWPDLREKVSDYISLASTHHGTNVIDAGMLCARGCAPSIFQQRPGSRLLAALNEGAEAWGPADYTAIYSANDTTVIPATTTARLSTAGDARVSNVLLQDICPENRATHNGMLIDGLAYAVVMDALTHDGPADPSRIDQAACAQTVIPGLDPARAANLLAQRVGPAGPRIAGFPAVPEEPALRPYARPVTSGR
jgi:pimeloyl-ACP methyl ester carboxylesterase